MVYNKNKFIDILQKREVNFKKKFGYNDCGFFVCKTDFVKNNLKKLILNKKIFTKKTKEYDFLHALKYFNQLQKVGFIITTTKTDTVGINKLSEIKKYEKSINYITGL